MDSNKRGRRYSCIGLITMFILGLIFGTGCGEEMGYDRGYNDGYDDAIFEIRHGY